MIVKCTKCKKLFTVDPPRKMSRTCGDHRPKYFVIFLDDGKEIFREEFHTFAKAHERRHSYKGSYDIKIIHNGWKPTETVGVKKHEKKS